MECTRCGEPLQKRLSTCLRCGAQVTKPSRTAEAESKAKSQPEKSTAPPMWEAKSPESSNRPEGSILGWVIAAILFVVISVFVLELSSNRAPVRSVASSDRPTQTQTTPSTTKLTESKPPVGENHFHSHDQIRYCLAETIRLEAMKSSVDEFSAPETELFNSFVNDYNSRCGSYRYRDGSLNSVSRSIKGSEGQYQQEGISRLQSWRQQQTTLSSLPSFDSEPKLEFSHLVKDTQKILNSLGYKPGSVNGLADEETKSAVRQFQKDHGFQVDGVINQQLYSRVYKRLPRDIPTKKASQPVQYENEQEVTSDVKVNCNDFKATAPKTYQLCIEFTGQGAQENVEEKNR